jgi:hypothetical protein
MGGKSPDPKPSMPLSVTQRRAAVRQFVAEQHGRPEDKRLEGPQVRKKAPEATTEGFVDLCFCFFNGKSTTWGIYREYFRI